MGIFGKLHNFASSTIGSIGKRLSNIKHVVRGFILNPQDASVIDYPPSIDTDLKKLHAVYSIIEQMRVEHNKQGSIAKLEPSKYIKSGIWKRYVKQFEELYEPLLREQSFLRGKIRAIHYTEEQWAKLNQDAILDSSINPFSIFGDKEVEKVKPTLAISPNLDTLKTIKIEDMTGNGLSDPLEDFTTYTEVDPGSDVTVTANTITLNEFVGSSTTYVYKDYGAGHFIGDFEHLIEYNLGNSTEVDAIACPYVLATDLGAVPDLYDDVEIVVRWLRQGEANNRLYLYLYDGGYEDSDNYNSLSIDTSYYLKIARTTGSPTDINVYIYSDDSRTTLVDTLLAQSGYSSTFSHIYPLNSLEGAAKDSYATISNLDLQEAVPAGSRSNCAILLNEGII